jgi:photosystem II stability/assembly factor-like uncharacterized protein
MYIKLKIFIALYFTIIILHSSVSAQQLDKPTFFDVQNQFNEKWALKPYEKGKGYAVFKRWEWYWEQRVDRMGHFPAQGQVLQSWNEYLAQQDQSNLRGANDSGNWIPLGPTTSPGGYEGLGRVSCITFHPTDSATFWVGTPAGGLWKTTDYGKNWKPFGDFSLPTTGVSDIVIDYKNTSVMYVGTGDRDFGSVSTARGMAATGDTKSAGILKSLDGGLTWAATGLSFTIQNEETVNRVVMHPTKNYILWAATSAGIYITTDSGLTWTRKKTGRFIDLEVNPSFPNYVYASQFDPTSTGGAQIYRSTDGGFIWKSVTTFTNSQRINIEISPASPLVVHAIVAGIDEGLNGLYKSVDTGGTFTRYIDGGSGSKNYLNSTSASGTGGQGGYDLTLAINPKNAQQLFLGGVNTWKSTNGGSTWSLSNYWTNPSSAAIVHADKHFHTYHPLAKSPTGVVFEGNDGGVYYSRDNGSSWTHITNTMQIGQVYRLSSSQTNQSILMAGHQDNGTKKMNGTTWSSAKGGDGMKCIVDPTDANVMYAAIQYGKIYRSTDGFKTGANESQISNNIAGGTLSGNGSWITPYTLDPSNSQIIYAGYNDVYKSTDQGDNWTAISTNLSPSSKLKMITVSPKNGNIIYAGTFYNIWKTSNGGTNWVNITSKIGGISSAVPSSITLHPTDTSIAWVTFSGFAKGVKIYKTIDGGKTWTNISGSLPNVPASCLVYEKNSSDGIYIGTDVGVFYRNSNFSDWTYFSRKLPLTPVIDLDIQNSGKKLRAGTHGRGVWETNLWSSTPPATPQASFYAIDSHACVGAPVNFKNTSNNFTQLFWTFTNGVPSTSTDTTPAVRYYTAGRYKATLIATGLGGADTTISDTFITVFPAAKSPAISRDSNRLVVNGVYSTYQWIKDGTPIMGAVAATYDASENAGYRLEITDSNGCKGLSNLLNFKYINYGVLDIAGWAQKVSIYPNPAHDKLYIEASLIDACDLAFNLIDVQGKSIYQGAQGRYHGEINISLDLSKYAKGIYLLQIVKNGTPLRPVKIAVE